MVRGAPQDLKRLLPGLLPLAPARATPADTVNRINTDVNALLGANDVREALMKQGLVAAGGRPQRLADLVTLELARWPQVVAKAGIRAD